MNVNASRRADVAVPQKPLCQFQAACARFHDTSGRVSKRMKSRSSLDSRNAQTLRRGIQHVPAKYVGIERCSIRFTEHEIVRAGAPRVSARLGQDTRKHFGEPNCSFATL